jgi:exopolysaccharide biosynthesis polyprenyl glycosylphosphotransferase
MLKEDIFRKSILFLDAVIISAAFFAAVFVRTQFHNFYTWNLFPELNVADYAIPVGEYLGVLFLVVPLWILMLHINGMYTSMRTRKLHQVLWIVLKSAFFAVLGFGALVFLFKIHFVSRLFFIIFVSFCLLFLTAEKIIILATIHHIRRKGISFRYILIVGTGRRAANVIRTIEQHPEWGLRILGAIDDEPARGVKKVEDVDVIGPIHELSRILHNHAVDEVIFVVPRSRLSFIEEAVLTCETEGVRASVAGDLFDMRIAHSVTSELNGIPLITFESTVAQEWGLFVKRLIDLVLSGLGILIASPVLLITAVLVKATSKGPVIFKQRRLGLSGRVFNLYKFRTMVIGAEQDLSDMDVVHDSNSKEFKKRKTRYITPVGRFLRKFSLDELPQLFNVFWGHMSLVGPRPVPAQEVSQYKPWQRRRMSMRPGITCLWQISGRNKISFEDWMKMDLEYIDNWSPWLDIKILAKTVPVVIFGIGAY